MTLRSPELRDAYALVKADKKAQRKARKEAARDHIRAIVASKTPNQRQPREKDNGYLQALRRVPCAICGALPSDAAHLRFTNMAVGRRNPGMGMKSHDRFATPLCRVHHTAQHDAGNEAAWWAAHRMDPDALAAGLYAAFMAGGDMAAVVQEHRVMARHASTTERRQEPRDEPENGLGSIYPKRRVARAEP